LGQGFSKVFDVKFKDKDEKEHYAWQTSWGFSTRLIGALIMAHGDDKGLVLPPNVATNKVVVVPILFGDSKDKVLKKSKEIARGLKKYGVILDDREGYSPGWKFNEWEMKGVPLRIEVGPKDLEKKQVTIVRRDNGKKESFSEKKISEEVPKLLEDIQNSLYKKAEKHLKGNIVEAKNMKELKAKLKDGKIVKAYMIDDIKIEEKIKDETGGATSRIIEEVKREGVCVKSGKKTNTLAYFAKSY
jgi:prolyl-tRNA synthetase